MSATTLFAARNTRPSLVPPVGKPPAQAGARWGGAGCWCWPRHPAAVSLNLAGPLRAGCPAPLARLTMAIPDPLPPWRALLRGAREREGRAPQARWLQLASVAADGTPRVRTLVSRARFLMGCRCQSTSSCYASPWCRWSCWNSRASPIAVAAGGWRRGGWRSRSTREPQRDGDSSPALLTLLGPTAGVSVASSGMTPCCSTRRNPWGGSPEWRSAAAGHDANT